MRNVRPFLKYYLKNTGLGIVISALFFYLLTMFANFVHNKIVCSKDFDKSTIIIKEREAINGTNN